MDNKSFRFKIGNFECVVISDGSITLPDTEPQKSPGQHDAQPGRTLDVQCLFIRTEEHKILIDTGCGVAGINPNEGKLLDNLRAEGIKRTEIDTIIHTHGHGDHIGGNTDAKGRPAFPNARYIMHKKEWKFWTSRLGLKPSETSEDQTMLAAARKNLRPIQDRFDLVSDETEIVPGIKFILAPGHTPGSIVLVISSGTEQLLCVGDLLHHPLEFTQPDLFNIFDDAPKQAIRTKAQIMSLAAASGALVFAYHFPFPGLGHLAQKGNKFVWQPIENASH